ncbi:ABC transporter permease [Porphyromonas loveana]|uniref:Putative ABC transport system permease protein n=2 Tax=Porphyromonas loveana TaxID=1884669 RepID=A0A2U1F8Z4_9PORP|nr:ABC transporter permease [Porphyromonas loveana]PVZ08663.1 putative ABC transport system permease protein [Porphyromonas loveana]
MRFFDRDRWVEIWHTIRSNRRRSLATAFGVFWGIFMLVILTSVGAGFSNGILREVSGIAANSVFYWTNTTSKPYQGFRSGRYWGATTSDLQAVRSQVREVEYISPVMWARRTDNNVVFGEKAETFNVVGAEPDYFEINRLNVLQGRSLNAVDNQQQRKVCMIGKEVRDKLFAGTDPVGQVLRVNGLYYRVIGVVEAKSNNVNIGSSPKSTVYISYSVLQQLENRGNKVYNFAVSAHPTADMKQMFAKIETIIRSRNNIAPDDDKALSKFDISAQFQLMNMIFTGINLLVWIVGIGTLLTGIVGVSNIMLVTVRERTREIGVRRALGAKPRTIIGQILSESLLLTALAGLSGLILGVGVMSVVDTITAQASSDGFSFISPLIPFGTAMLSLFIIIAGGILGGMLPAYRAIQIKAIDAIRDE